MSRRKRKKVLICGASIAGPALAYWLDADQYEVTVVERAAKLRTGGQNIDIRGAGKAVVDLMGLTAAVKSAHTGELGLRFVDAAGRAAAEFPADGGRSFTSDREILRGDLSRIFYDATKDRARYLFGTTVTALADGRDRVEVTFGTGDGGEFDHVIAADGLGSKTRGLIIAGAFAYKYLGIYTSYFDVARRPGDGMWAEWYNAKGGRVMMLRPGHDGALSASVSFAAERSEALEAAAEATQRERVRQVLAGGGWQCERIAAGLDAAADFYLGPVSQVLAPRWSKGRCALIGDAAYGPSPVSGMGTTLAIVGAYILGNELNMAADHQTAFAGYEAKLRSYVERSQHLPPGVPRLAHPKTQLGVHCLNGLAHVVASLPVQKLLAAARRGDRPAAKGEFVLPRYRQA